MAKIPKNLTDKDMFKGFKEEKSLEDLFLEADEKEAKVKQQKKAAAHEVIEIAYLTPDIVDKLGKMLLELKLSLFKEGIVDYTMSIRREGNNIILSPKEKK